MTTRKVVNASMAELADALALGASGLNPVEVRPLLLAPNAGVVELADTLVSKASG